MLIFANPPQDQPSASAAAEISAPTSAAAADSSNWQGWAFEMRGDGLVGWVGAWTPGACEVQRLEAIEAKLDASIGACHPVALTDEPAGIAVWVICVPTPALLPRRRQRSAKRRTPLAQAFDLSPSRILASERGSKFQARPPAHPVSVDNNLLPQSAAVNY